MTQRATADMRITNRPFTNDSCTSWMRDQQCDLHLILKSMRPAAVDNSSESEFICPMADNLLPQVLDEWLRTECPSTPMGILRRDVVDSKHYWQSWFIPYVQFDPAGLARYIEVWEGSEQRASQARFRRKTISYSSWRTELSSYKIYDSARLSPATALWFDTPIGLLWSPWDPRGDYVQEAYKKAMIWLRAQEIFPALAHAAPQDVVSGTLLPDDRNEGAWICLVRPNSRRTDSEAPELSSRYVGNESWQRLHQRKLCDFLGIGHARATFMNDGWG
jgi:hypothetical protein